MTSREILERVAAFPAILPRHRVLYYDVLGEAEVELLRRKGYDPISVLTLGRKTPEEMQRYLLASLQAMNDGLMNNSDTRRRALELELKTHGMLRSEGPRTVNIVLPNADAADLLNWDKSRHGNIGNSTVQSVIKLKLLKEKPNDNG